jgi:hypothetical protein
VYGSEGWEIGGLLGRFLVLWRRWGGLLESIFGWVAWEFVVGYIICKGARG